MSERKSLEVFATVRFENKLNETYIVYNMHYRLTIHIAQRYTITISAAVRIKIVHPHMPSRILASLLRKIGPGHRGRECNSIINGTPRSSTV